MGAACDENSPKPEDTGGQPPQGTEDTASPPEPEPGERFLHGVYEFAEGVYDDHGVLIDGCMPAPRRHAQVAYFFEPLGSAGVHYGSGPLMQRGFFLYGGVDDAGNALDDLWVFDLSRRFQQACDWTKLSDDATPFQGVAEGALVYDDGMLHLVGGREQIGGAWTAHAFIDSLDLALGGTFDAALAGQGPTMASEAWVEGAEPCSDEGEWQCTCADAGGCAIPYDYQASYLAEFGESSADYGDPLMYWLPGDGLDFETFRTAICDEIHLGQGTLDPYGASQTPNWHLVEKWTDQDACAANLGTACQQDPLCTHGYVKENPVVVGASCGDVPWLGTHGAAWAYHPLEERLLAHGGTVGCTGAHCATDLASCDDLLLGRVDDGGHDVSGYDLHTLNGHATRSFAVPALAEDTRSEDRSYLSLGFDAEGEPLEVGGVRHAAGAVSCLDWSLAGDVTLECEPTYVLWGGTKEQALQPFQFYTVTPELDDGWWTWLHGADPADPNVDQGPNSVPRSAAAAIGGSWAFRAQEGRGLGLRYYDGTGASCATTYDPAFVYAEGWDGALAAVGSTHVVAMGGFDKDGDLRNDIVVIDMGYGCEGTVVQRWESPAVVGNGLATAYDPVEQRAWFYGAMSGGDLHWVEDSEVKPRRITDLPANVVLTRLEQEVELTGADLETGPWTFRTAMTMQIQWELPPGPDDPPLPPGEPYGQRVWLRIPHADAMTVQQAHDHVHVKLRSAFSGSEWYDLELDDDVGFSGGAATGGPLAFFSPFVLPHGSYEVIVEVTDRMHEPGTNVQSGHFLPAGGCTMASNWAELKDVVAVPWHAPPAGVAESDWDGPLYWGAGTFAFTRYVGLDSTRSIGVVSAGRYDEDCVASTAQILDPATPDAVCVDQSQSTKLRHMPGHAVFLMEDLIPYEGDDLVVQSPNNPAVSATWHVDGWQDLCLAADEVTAFATLMANVPDAVAAVDARIGLATMNDIAPLAVTDAMVVARRPRPATASGSDGSAVVGYTLNGQVHLTPFTDEGIIANHASDVVWPSGTSQKSIALLVQRNVLVHELTHVFLHHADLPPWAREGLAQVVAWSEDPDTNRHGMMNGLIARVGAWIDQKADVWERIRNPAAPAPSTGAAENREARKALYEASPYLITQAISAHYGGDDDAFWSAVRASSIQRVGHAGDVADSPHPVLDDADWTSLLGTVYSERIQHPSPLGHVGEPLLSLQDFDLPGGSTASVEVRQVQQDLLITDQGTPFSVFSQVPYSLGCSVLDGNYAASSTDVAFDECGTTAKGPGTAGTVLMATLAGASDVLALTAAPGVDVSTGDVPVPGSTQAVAFTLFAHHLLWPDRQAAFQLDDDVPSSLMADLPSPPYVALHKHKLPSNTKLVVTPDAYLGVEVIPGWLDVDGDGFAAPTDCDDANNAVFPGNSAWPLNASGGIQQWLSTNTPSFGLRVDEMPENIDLDCNGWPLDFWRMVEVTK